MRLRSSPLVAALVLVACCLLATVALARPGGGQAFGGGTPHSSGHGGGGGGNVNIGLVIELVILCFRYPPLGGAVVLVVVGYAVVQRLGRGKLTDWSVGAPETRVRSTRHATVARSALNRLRQSDPAFSVVLLEDFVYALYAELQVRRPHGGLRAIEAFVAPEVATALADPSLEAVTGVIVGALRFTSFTAQGDWVVLGVELEVNLGEARGGQTSRYYAVDRLVLVRAAGARSRPPARARKLDCANCGAPLESLRGTRCAYCQNEVGGGRLDWLVREVHRLHTEARPPLVTGNVEERGNELPTLRDPGAEQRLGELASRDPGFSRDALFARIGLVFSELQRGWSTRNLAPVRPYVTDNLFQYFGYWVNVYQQARARNVTENARILRLELANVLTDTYYDAVTVRLFATGLDYTLSDDDGRVLSGSRRRERAYSEYWTLVRGRGAKGPARTTPSCPSCGAPLKIAMAGNCEYCHARVVSGEFDWVLSRIEQDEVYGG